MIERTATIPLSHRRALTVATYTGEDGTVERVLLGAGYTSHNEHEEHLLGGRSLSFRPDILPSLCAALAALQLRLGQGTEGTP